MTIEEARERVSRGAALLDEKRPGWAESLRYECIEMDNCYRCVLGRLYGEYSRGLYAIGAVCIGASAARYGFYAESWDRDLEAVEYALLHQAWMEAISHRLYGTEFDDAPVVTWTPRDRVLVQS